MMVIGAYAALAVFVAVLRSNRGWWLSQHLFSKWGPRTDVPCMTRRQLFAEGVRFLLLGALCAAVCLTVAWITDLAGLRDRPGAILLVFMTFILAGMGGLAGIYMLVCGIFRSRRYTPPPGCWKRRIATAPATVPIRPLLAPVAEPGRPLADAG